MTPRHWIALGLFFGTLSTHLLALDSWEHFTDPKSIALLLGQIGGFLVALYGGKPDLDPNGLINRVGTATKMIPED